MKGMKSIIKIISLAIILVGMYIVYLSFQNNDRIKVSEWNNIYNETNLDFYYNTGEEENLKELEKVYKINKIVSGQTIELEKVLKVNSILKNIVSFDDVKNSKYINGYDILKEKAGSKKVSARDMAIIFRDLLGSIGIDARIGEFKNYKKIFSKDESYYIIEYWDKQNEKWVAIDFMDNGYFSINNIPLSATEIMNETINKTQYKGLTDSKKVKKKYKKIADGYTVYIDNTLKREKSNTTVTYIKEGSKIRVMHNNKFLPSNIYTTLPTILDKSPHDAKEGEDKRAYIVIMKKEGSPNEDKAKYKNTFIIGGFKDSKILEEYYLNINNKGMEEINKYYELELTSDKNTIEISLDGKNVTSKVVLINKE